MLIPTTNTTKGCDGAIYLFSPGWMKYDDANDDADPTTTTIPEAGARSFQSGEPESFNQPTDSDHQQQPAAHYTRLNNLRT